MLLRTWFYSLEGVLGWAVGHSSLGLSAGPRHPRAFTCSLGPEFGADGEGRIRTGRRQPPAAEWGGSAGTSLFPGPAAAEGRTTLSLPLPRVCLGFSRHGQKLNTRHYHPPPGPLTKASRPPLGGLPGSSWGSPFRTLLSSIFPSSCRTTGSVCSVRFGKGLWSLVPFPKDAGPSASAKGSSRQPPPSSIIRKARRTSGPEGCLAII